MFVAILVVTASLAASPTITAAAGTGERGFSGDGGPATAARLDNPFDLAFDSAGNLYFSDTNNHRIRRVDVKTGIITTVAGSGKKGYTGDGGPATQCEMNEPYGVELDREGNLYFVDRLNFCVRKVEAKTGIIRTIAGTGKSAYGGDGGPADKAGFVEPNGIALDGKGNLYVADVRGQRLRIIDLKTSTIHTFCGTGKKADEGDGGPYTKASLNGPRAVAVAPDGKTYIVEREGHCVRRIDPQTGVIERYAGTGSKGFSGDGGPALKATFNGPKEIDIAKNGDIYIVDTENEVIRKIDAKSGIVSTVAGKGPTKSPGSGDGGPATQATLGRPHGVAVDSQGHIYIGDTLSHRIRVVK